MCDNFDPLHGRTIRCRALVGTFQIIRRTTFKWSNRYRIGARSREKRATMSVDRFRAEFVSFSYIQHLPQGHPRSNTGLAITPSPKDVRNPVTATRCRRAGFLGQYQGCFVRCVWKRLQRHHVVDRKRDDRHTVRKPELPKSCRRIGLANCGGDEKSKFTSRAQPMVHGRIENDGRDVALDAARVPATGDKAIIVTERFASGAIAPGKTTPSHPRRISNDIADIPDRLRGKMVLNNSAPDLVPILCFEILDHGNTAVVLRP